MQRKPPPLEKIQASQHSPEHPILTKVKTMKRPSCPWTDERIRKTCSREAMKKPFSATWMQVREVHTSDKGKCHVISLGGRFYVAIHK